MIYLTNISFEKKMFLLLISSLMFYQVSQRERECLCVRERVRPRECVCVCVRERERERERECCIVMDGCMLMNKGPIVMCFGEGGAEARADRASILQ